MLDNLSQLKIVGALSTADVTLMTAEHGVGVNSSCVLIRAVLNAVIIGQIMVGGVVHLGLTGEQIPNVHRISVMR